MQEIAINMVRNVIVRFKISKTGACLALIIYIILFLGCPEGWLAGPDSCYFMPNKSTSQRKFAVNKCKNFGGHLVNIETEAENNFLSVLFSDFSGGRWEFLRS